MVLCSLLVDLPVAEWKSGRVEKEAGGEEECRLISQSLMKVAFGLGVVLEPRSAVHRDAN